jgi:hypothetical protein
VFAAAQTGHVEAIRVFCGLGADINAAAKNAVSPAHIAADRGHEKVVKLLRKLGAKMDADTALHGTPLTQALLKGNDAMAEKLMRDTSQCACCQQKATATVKLLACSRCRKTFYCSAACQKQDWKKHKLADWAARTERNNAMWLYVPCINPNMFLLCRKKVS